MDELSAALAFDRAIRVRGARRTVDLPEGLVVLHPDLPTIYHLNVLMLDGPLGGELDGLAVSRLADEWLGHLGHRHVILDDPADAERLWPELSAAGWTRQRTLYMCWRGEPADRTLARDDRSREISDAELRALQLELFAQERGVREPGADAFIGALAGAQKVLRAATPSRCFGAGEDGELQAMSTLFLDGEQRPGSIAMIEEVGTSIGHRRRGLGRAVVTAALQKARDLDREPIVIPADADDWPQLMYAKLGFAPVGQQVSFTLTRPVASGQP